MVKKNFLFRIAFTIIFILFFLLSPFVNFSLAAPTPIKSSMWELFNNDGIINFTENERIEMFSTNNIQSFPFGVLDLNSSISDDYEIEFDINFPRVTDWGVGLRLGNLKPLNSVPINEFGDYINQENNFSKLIFFQVWQDNTNRFHTWFCPDELNKNTCVRNQLTNPNLHLNNRLYHSVTTDKIKFIIDKKGSLVKVYIQNLTKNAPLELLFQSTTTRIPSYLLLGNNVKTGSPLPYTFITLESKLEIINKPKYILVPGFFGSWNREAMLHNNPVDILEWKLNPIVREYDGVINTFKNIGLVENDDFFVFPYDWRKKIESSAKDLDSFISTQIPDSDGKINLVGHSLGGLVSRIYTQNNPEKIDKIITVGSPHKGLAQTYKAVEAGELDQDNTLTWLAQKSVLALNRTGIETDRVILNRVLPVAQDLMPIYDFLKDQNEGSLIPINQMIVTNDTMRFYNNNLTDPLEKLQTIIGEKGPTPFGFTVEKRSDLDEILDIYPDGRPISSQSDIGDLIILSNSAKMGASPITLADSDHGEIIYKKAGIKKILDSLGLDFEEQNVAQGAQTTVSPALVFFIKSPAFMEVEHDGIIYPEKDGMIFIPNAKSDNYNLKVTGIENGAYTVHIGQIGFNSDYWSQIPGQIIADPPSSQKDIYQINFNPSSPQDPLADPVISLENIIAMIDKINNPPIKYIKDAKRYMNEANKFYLKHDFKNVPRPGMAALNMLLAARHKTNEINKAKLLDIAKKWEIFYSQMLSSYEISGHNKRLEKELKETKTKINKRKKALLDYERRGGDISRRLPPLVIAENKLNDAQNAFEEGDLHLAEAMIVTTNFLFIEAN